MRTNDLILRTTTILIAFILLAFSIYLFIAGHNAPGGGFIGGLMTAAAVVLMYMTYGFDSVKKIIPINFRYLIPIGLLTAVLTGMGSFVYGEPFLSQTFAHFSHIPILGEVELATALLFDLGVYLTVVGITLTIILSIANDQ
ncbi:Na(+)/H(+) antiporter subunit B [Pontibacillus yanchengensis]|uniref:Na(+)/H(+) antiporter subunit B n=2 Tax=Pontibacillus yanchengensis TaxID=462910 RepID=A0ACC7VCJ0_9BACI|nr:Na(+)/H(+) antiporter subunit B [Pontibacillus yanchengensis]MYL33260.1 Na(+)/H(+) antiporter subunit B [Pontibacillus yanchengensis]MYL51904.1 Na(+)/H(+) antiporter subunit B [Pontibacillus yanchengensis]